MNHSLNDLSKKLTEFSDSYHGYEYKDFLKIFCLAVEDLVAKSDTISLEGFGKFQPKVNKAKPRFHPKTQQWTEGEESSTIKFVPSRVLLDRLKGKENKE